MGGVAIAHWSWIRVLFIIWESKGFIYDIIYKVSIILQVQPLKNKIFNYLNIILTDSEFNILQEHKLKYCKFIALNVVINWAHDQLPALDWYTHVYNNVLKELYGAKGKNHTKETIYKDL